MLCSLFLCCEIHFSYFISLSLSLSLSLFEGAKRTAQSEGSLVEGTKTWAQLTPAEKVVEGGKDSGSALVIGAGLTLCGYLLYSVVSELVFRDGPEQFFERSLKRITNDEEVRLALGDAVTFVGSMKGPNKPWRMQEYVVDGTTYTRMRYEIKGDRARGVVHLEMKKPASGKPTMRYLFADLQGPLGNTNRVVLEDNRIEDKQAASVQE
ncbi:uncharacterized protein MONBRDRAFT_23273 [Monosiga brevicollis MX1]|uniref:Mitochondrial import inner membrane translocase subunit Tim21 n=1 Tax=Monosiga brevicollis TaxID=81824 RepID=A9USX2_MONBE|nr:uncharacterized protein MONBRDRAFT_23273 [Monosiga brevicollis MX1]EDQ91140.1 predicted protein [Monosiga brevicollis MX1]|eukprot:XP_001743562.1 hypothetical protein [Monosiga brevicollis MX1]